MKNVHKEMKKRIKRKGTGAFHHWNHAGCQANIL